MSRPRVPGRLETIAEAAITVFSRSGYKNAQMADIAREAGVSAGTLYLYVQNKEGSFWLALLRSADMPLPSIEDGPIPAKAMTETFREIGQWLDTERLNPELFQALNSLTPQPDIETELRRILEVRYDVIARYRRLIRLIEHAAQNWPELAILFYSGARRSVVDSLAQYLELRSKGGHLRPIEDPATASRLVIETMAWFAMHRHGDPDSATITDESARKTSIDMLFHALIKTSN